MVEIRLGKNSMYIFICYIFRKIAVVFFIIILILNEYNLSLFQITNGQYKLNHYLYNWRRLKFMNISANVFHYDDILIKKVLTLIVFS